MKIHLPATYRIQHGCRNCIHCVVLPNPDYTEYYCGFGAPPFPVRQPHEESHIDLEAADRYWERRCEWDQGRDVQPWAICDHHKVAEESGNE
jgi:hypothetical protein